MPLREQQLRNALDAFLEAFRYLDWAPFIAAFSPSASAFFPFADAPRRAEGSEEIEAIFRPFFESLRSRQPAGPPYLQLDPADLKVTITGTVALVSFHLFDSADGQAILCRRSFVWIEENGQWRILHLHASNLPVD